MMMAVWSIGPQLFHIVSKFHYYRNVLTQTTVQFSSTLQSHLVAQQPEKISAVCTISSCRLWFEYFYWRGVWSWCGTPCRYCLHSSLGPLLTVFNFCLTFPPNWSQKLELDWSCFNFTLDIVKHSENLVFICSTVKSGKFKVGKKIFVGCDALIRIMQQYQERHYMAVFQHLGLTKTKYCFGCYLLHLWQKCVPGLY